MSYFKDLSTYTYFPTKEDVQIVNVGWLEDGYEFETGIVAGHILEKLVKMAEIPENLTRGLHYCEFCDPPIFSPRGENFVCTLIKDAPNGNGEIWVKSNNGKIYVAPVLIIHYIEVHKYKPPKEFLAALSNA